MVQSVLRLLVACSLWSTVHSFNIDYSSAAQCETVALAWVKTDASETQQFAFPLYLNILPFNSTASVLRIDSWDDTMDAGKVILDHFPLGEGTQYLLGVTDSVGRGVGRTSSIQTVQAGNDSSCLRQAGPGMKFTVTPTNPNECPSLTVNYSESSNPSILFFAPGHTPFTLADEDSQGSIGSVKTPKGKYTSFTEAVVLFQHENGTAQTSPLTIVAGVDHPECTPPPEVVSTSSSFPFGYHPRTAAIMIAFILAGVVTIFIAVFLAFWWWRRSRKVPDEESAQVPSNPAEKNPEGSVRALSMRTNRGSSNIPQINAIEPALPDRSSARRRPDLRVDVPPMPPMPDSGKVTGTSGGFISDSPDTARTDSSKRRSILRKQTNPSSARKRRFLTEKFVPPSSFVIISQSTGSSKAAMRKGSVVSDVTMTDETSLAFPDIEPRPDSPTVPSILFGPIRPNRRTSTKSKSNGSSKRSHRDYAQLVEGDDAMPSRRSTMSNLLSKSRSRSLPRLSSRRSTMSAMPSDSRSHSVPRSS